MLIIIAKFGICAFCVFFVHSFFLAFYFGSPLRFTLFYFQLHWSLCLFSPHAHMKYSWAIRTQYEIVTCTSNSNSNNKLKQQLQLSFRTQCSQAITQLCAPACLSDWPLTICRQRTMDTASCHINKAENTHYMMNL